MRLTVIHIAQRIAMLRRVMAGVMIACALAGCDDRGGSLIPDEPPVAPSDPDFDPDHTYISMVINTFGRASAPDSRTVRDDGAEGWGDPYDSLAGSGVENAVDPARVHVMLYDADGAPLGVVSSADSPSRVKLYPVSEADGIYHIVFDATDMGIFRNRDYMAAVVVNTAERPDPSHPGSVAFDYSELPGSGSDGGGLIPMFGFKRWRMGTFDFPDGYPAFPSIGTIDMLRAVSKVEVRISDDFSDHERARFLTLSEAAPPRLNSIGLHLNRRGFAVPREQFWKAGNRDGIRDLTFNESFHENTSLRWNASSADENLVFPLMAADRRSACVYVPEASGASMRPVAENLRLIVTALYQTPDMTEPQVIVGTMFPSVPFDEDLQNYPAGTDFRNWKLTRNHIYRFIITDFVDETAFKYAVSATNDQTITVPDFD